MAQLKDQGVKADSFSPDSIQKLADAYAEGKAKKAESAGAGGDGKGGAASKEEEEEDEEDSSAEL